MSKEVQNAIGTQRQFAKQPEMPYALSLNKMNFGAGISQSTDVDAQRLQSALGLLGKNVMEERIAMERRDQEQAVLVNADKLLAGKSQEDLRKFDRMAALQNSTDEFDLTDNRYAMAALEKGIGKMASTYAKQQWANDPDSEKPKSVSDAVGLYNRYLQDNRAAFTEDTIYNKTAFDAGYYEGAAQDTIKVANEADKRINDDRRQKMVMLGSSELQDLIYSGAKGEDFANGIIPALRKIQLGTKDRDGYMKAVTPLLAMIADKDFTTERLDALGDFQYEDGLSLKQMINFYPSYEKVAENFNLRVTDDIVSKCTRPDGTIDLSKAETLLSQLPSEFTGGDGVPSANLPISAGDNPDLADLSEKMKAAMPLVGGAIYQLGFKDAQITSGYRTVEHNAAVGGAQNSYHTKGDAVDIYLGDNVDEASAEKAKAYFGQYFGEVLFHDAGTGRHLHLADYKGGLKGANPKEQSAAAYNPQRIQKIRQSVYAKQAQAERIKRQKDEDEKDRVYNALLQTTDPNEQLNIINNSNLSPMLKTTLTKSATRTAKQLARGYGNDAEGKHFWRYETGYQYIKDVKKFAEWQQADIDLDTDEGAKLQKEANKAVARLNELLEFKKSRGLIPSDEKQKASSSQSKSNYNPADDTPTLTEKDRSMTTLRIYANSNPTTSLGTPLSKEQIEQKIRKAALEEGWDDEQVIKEIFGDEEGGD